MSLTLKISSLVIRTAAKPIGVCRPAIGALQASATNIILTSSQNYIKRQAREHDRFRRICVTFAQGLHKLDMRLRLGLLQDPAAIERQIAREAAEAEARRKALKGEASMTTVLTQEQTLAAKSLTEEEHKKIEEKVKNEEKSKTQRRIRPLSEAKAIDSGANFISEAFLFCVAGGLILFEAFRSRRKEATRQRGVEDRLKDLEEEVQGLEEERDRYRELVEDFKEALDMLKGPNGPSAATEITADQKFRADLKAVTEEEESGSVAARAADEPRGNNGNSAEQEAESAARPGEGR